jgi:EmrB/QacA subfamily drug resistance transporter
MLNNIKNSPKARWFILADVLLGTFMATLDSSIVNVALPTISTQLNVTLSVVQWVVVSYLLAIASLLPMFGRLADMLGRNKVYSIGFLVFTLGSALCGMFNTIWMLVAMRVFQAFGASMMMATNQAIIVSNFPVSERGRALGLLGTFVALGSLTGPALGGFLVSWVGWRSIFFVNVPLGIIGYLLAQIVLPADKDKKEAVFDYKGSILFTVSLIGILFALNNGNVFGWSSPLVLVSFFVGVVLLFVFFLVEFRMENPLINFSIYRNRVFMLGNFSAFLNFGATFANAILMPFYLQTVLHYSSFRVGLMMAFLPICMAIIAPISGYGSDKIGPIWFATGGLLLNALGFLYLLSVTTHSTFSEIIPSLVLVGVGTGMFQPPNNSSVMSSVRRDQIGIVNGLNALIRNLGMIMGASLSVLILERLQGAILAGIANPTQIQTASSFVEAFHIVMAFMAGISVCAAIISFSRKSYLSS